MTPTEKGLLMRRSRELKELLRDAKAYEHDHRLQRFIKAAHDIRSYEAMQIALDYWRDMPEEERTEIEARAAAARTHEAIAARISTPDLVEILADQATAAPRSTPHKRRVWEARLTAYRTELQARREGRSVGPPEEEERAAQRRAAERATLDQRPPNVIVFPTVGQVSPVLEPFAMLFRAFGSPLHGSYGPVIVPPQE